MSRRARYTLPDIPQYVVQRGNNGEAVFLEEKDYQYFADCLQDAALQYACQVHAYVFLHNQVQLLITQQTSNGIAQLFQSLGRRYVRYFNDLHGRTGTLWEGRYKSCLIGSESYQMACHRYIDLYPVRLGLVKNAEEYHWSSARRYILGYEDCLVKSYPAYHALGDTADISQENYKKFLQLGVPKVEVKLIQDAIRNCGVLGDNAFKLEVERILGWRVRPRKPGRPPGMSTQTL